MWSIFQSIKTNCEGDYVQVVANNTPCLNDMQLVKEVTRSNPSLALIMHFNSHLKVFNSANLTSLSLSLSASKE